MGIISSLPFPAQIFRNYIPFILIFTLILPLFIRRKDSKNLKKALSLLILLLPLLLSSCFDSKEVDDMTYVVAVGADKEGYTFQLALPLNISGDKEADAEQEDEAFSLYSVKINEPDFKIATDKLNSKISKSADLSHISLFVFSEELVLEGLGDFYEVLSDIKIRPSAYLTVAQNPDEFLKSVSSPFELNPAKYYEMLYSNEERSSYESLTVYDFLSRDTLVMPISSSDGKEEGSYVLKSKKAMLKLSPEEMFYFRILKGSLPLSHIKNTAGTFELKSASHTDISLKENDAKIKIHLNGNKKTAYKITKGCKNLLLKAQKNNIDLLGIKDKTRKNFLTLETYQNSGFDIKNINFRTELVYEE